MKPAHIIIYSLAALILVGGGIFAYVSLVLHSEESTGQSWDRALSEVLESPTEVVRDEKLRAERAQQEAALAERDAFLHVEYKTPEPCIFHDKRIGNNQSVVAYEKRKVPYDQTCIQEERVCNDGVLSGSFIYESCRVEEDLGCYIDNTRMPNDSSRLLHSLREAPYPESCFSYAAMRVCRDGMLSGDASYQYLNCERQVPADCTIDGQTVVHGEFIRMYKDPIIPKGEVCLSQARICQEGVLSGEYIHQDCQVAEDSNTQ